MVDKNGGLYLGNSTDTPTQISELNTYLYNFGYVKSRQKAKTLIEDGAFDSISKVAMSVGYEDALYFSRAFKERYGISPSNMAKQ